MPAAGASNLNHRVRAVDETEPLVVRCLAAHAFSTHSHAHDWQRSALTRHQIWGTGS